MLRNADGLFAGRGRANASSRARGPRGLTAEQDLLREGSRRSHDTAQTRRVPVRSRGRKHPDFEEVAPFSFPDLVNNLNPLYLNGGIALPFSGMSPILFLGLLVGLAAKYRRNRRRSRSTWPIVSTLYRWRCSNNCSLERLLIQAVMMVYAIWALSFKQVPVRAVRSCFVLCNGSPIPIVTNWLVGSKIRE